MIMEIFIDDLFSRIKEYIDSFPEEYKNRYWRHCVIYTYAYEKIMSTPRNIELFYHKDQQQQWQEHKLPIVSGIYEDIEKDFHKSYDLADLQMKARIDMAADDRSRQGQPVVAVDRAFDAARPGKRLLRAQKDRADGEQALSNPAADVHIHVPPVVFIPEAELLSAR